MQLFRVFKYTLLSVSVASTFTILMHKHCLRRDKNLAVLPEGAQWVRLNDGHKLFLHQTNPQAPNTILIVNGFGADFTLVTKWQQLLSSALPLDAWNICVYDRSGYGYSDPFMKEPRTFEDLSDELHELIQNGLESKRVHILAASMGGLIAINYANKYDHLDSLYCIDPPFLKYSQNVNQGMAMMAMFVTKFKYLYEWGFMRWLWMIGLFPQKPADFPNENEQVWQYLIGRRGGFMSTFSAEGKIMISSDWDHEENQLVQLKSSSIPFRIILHEKWMPNMQKSYHDEWQQRACLMQELYGKDNALIMPSTYHTHFVDHPEELVEKYVGFVREYS